MHLCRGANQTEDQNLADGTNKIMKKKDDEASVHDKALRFGEVYML